MELHYSWSDLWKPLEGRVLTCTTQRRIHILSDFLCCAGFMCKWSCILIPRSRSVLAHNFARLGNNRGSYDLCIMEESSLPHFDEWMHWLTYQIREPDEKEGRSVAVICVFDPKWGIGNFKLYPLLQCYQWVYVPNNQSPNMNSWTSVNNCRSDKAGASWNWKVSSEEETTRETLITVKSEDSVPWTSQEHWNQGNRINLPQWAETSANIEKDPCIACKAILRSRCFFLLWSRKEFLIFSQSVYKSTKNATGCNCFIRINHSKNMGCFIWRCSSFQWSKWAQLHTRNKDGPEKSAEQTETRSTSTISSCNQFR